MPTADANGIQIAYDTFGDPSDPTLLLIMGLGAQMVVWEDELCELFASQGFHVVRFDNRDIGQSTWIDAPDLDAGAAIMAAVMGDPSQALYTLSDMAADTVGLLDHLGVDRAHVVGASMGGMIAQTVAIEHQDRVASLTSIMSTTGEPTVGTADPDLLGALVAERPTDPEASIEFGVDIARQISYPEHFDAERTRQRVKVEVSRGVNPDGVPHQVLAILASGSRADDLPNVAVPTLVIHGRADRLVGLSGGERTAELIPGAELLVFDDMAHDMPLVHIPTMVERITALAGRAS